MEEGSQVFDTGISDNRPGCTRLLWIGLERTEVSFNEFFNSLAERSKEIKFVCSDMWKPYLKVIKGEDRSGGSYFGSFSYSGSFK